MPLQHSESLADHDALRARVLPMFLRKAAAEGAPPGLADGVAAFCDDHAEVIKRFGRYPGRNKALGRENTEEEAAYLASGADTWGA